jgi:uncharacterized protein (DUF1697 family)
VTLYVALLRAVNVGGTGKLAMSKLRELCAEAGFVRIETYIASGNVIFESEASAKKVKAELEKRLLAHAGALIGVAVRTEAELAAVLKANPFPEAQPKFTVAIFLDEPAPRDALSHLTGRQDEEVALGKREIYAHFPSGIGNSKLRIPAAKAGTARNMNTVAALVALAAKA